MEVPTAQVRLESKFKESKFGIGQIKGRSNSVCPQGQINYQIVVMEYAYCLKPKANEMWSG